MRLVVIVLAIAVAVAASRAGAADGLDAAAGKALFDRIWVPAPSSTNASDGLGPLFNARSCAGCHIDAGGSRVVKRNGATILAGAVVRFGAASGGRDPFYGLQLQTSAMQGLSPEGSATFLPSFKYKIEGPPLTSGVAAGPRLAPSLAGRAAFGTIPDAEILKHADPDDANGDGISGRVNQLETGIGRYGWKAAHATLQDQIAHAFAIDLGLSSPRAPMPFGDCTAVQTECTAAPTGESVLFDNREVSTVMLDLVAEYLATVRAPDAAKDRAGAALFEKTGCAACHVPEMTSSDGSTVITFTDFLLHDMGRELDDHVGEPGVASSEWRTAPLIAKKTYPRDLPPRYTHDGAVKTVEEAIGRHGGEADRSRSAFTALTKADRKRLIDYVDQR